MADIPLQFPNLGNALAQGYHIRALREQSDELGRRRALGPDVTAAIGGDTGALGRVAAVDPDYALKIGPIMEAMDAKHRAKAGAAADYTYKAANAVLQADPASRADIYQQMLAEGRAQGHDLSRLPQQYTPGLEGQLRSWRQMAIPVLEQWKREESIPVPMGGGAPGGGAAGGAPAGWNGGTPGAPATVPQAAIPTGQGMVQTLTKQGLSPVAAAGVVGNLYQESGFNPKAIGDGGTAYGMAQWRNDRAAGLGQFAQQQGKSPTDPEVQLGFLVHEMKNGDMGAQRAWAMLQTAKTPEEATTAMMHFFRPRGYTPNNPQGGDSYAQRVQYARSFLPQGGPAPAAMPGAPPGLVPTGATAQMPGAPPVAAPRVPGPIAAPPSVAQGDTPQADASGTPLPPQTPAVPPPPSNELLREFVQRVRPGWWPLVDPVTQTPAYDHAGRLKVIGPNKERDTIALPKQAEVPFGWIPDGKGGYVADPKGPHGAEYAATIAEAKRKAEDGGVPGPFTGKSPTAIGLNILIADGSLTQSQAAQVAAGHYVTGPNGAMFFATPQGIVSQMPGGQPTPLVPPVLPPAAGASPAPPATPSAQPPAQNPGLVPVSPGQLKPIPDAANEKIATNTTLITNIDKAIKAYTDPTASIASSGRTAGFISRNLPGGDLIAQGMDPGGVTARALISDITSQITQARSGQAVTEGEAKRLIALLPSASDDPKVIATKLRQVRATAAELLRNQSSQYTKENGFIPPEGAQRVLTAPSPAEQARDKFNADKVNGGRPPLSAFEK